MARKSYNSLALRYERSDLVNHTKFNWDARWVVLFDGGFSMEQYSEVYRWLEDNIRPPFYVGQDGEIILRKEEDAMLCYLRFK